MKRLILSGLPPDVSEESIRTMLMRFGQVKQILIVRDGDPNQPVAIVEINLSDMEAFDLASRITDIWHDGRRVNIWTLRH